MMKILILFLTIGIFIASPISFTGCDKEEELPTATEIKSSALESFENIKTYEVAIDINIDTKSEFNEEERELEVTIKTDGIIDLANKQLEMAIDTRIIQYPIAVEQSELAVRIYLVDDMFYMKAEELLQTPGWGKSEPWEGLWDYLNFIEFQKDILKGSQVEVTGIEKVEGVECYVLQLTPDIKQIWELLAKHAMMSGGVGAFAVFKNTEELPWSFSMKQWIAKDTFFITKFETAINIEIPPDTAFLPDEEGTIALTMSSLTYNQNKKVSIELSPEAKAAVYDPEFNR